MRLKAGKYRYDLMEGIIQCHITLDEDLDCEELLPGVFELFHVPKVVDMPLVNPFIQYSKDIKGIR